MGDTTVGTAVIGGGIAGIALAYHLARLGETGILVLEGSEPASGCTGGSLGGIRQQFSTPDQIELARRGRAFWQTFEEAFDHPCTFYQDGYLILTGREDVWGGLVHAADMQRAGGAGPVELVPADELPSLFPWLNPTGLIGGSWTPEDGRANPTDGLYGLMRAARQLGVTVKSHTPVTGIERCGDDWVLQATEPITASRVVVAAGLGSPELLRPFGLELPITPMLIHSAFTTPVVQEHRLPLTIDLDTGLCLEREQDAAVVCMLESAAAPGYGPDDMLADFAEAAEVRAPVFTEVSIRSTVSAKADATGGDGRPFLGEVEAGLWTLTGFDAHGTMLGPVAAEFTANLMAGIPDAVLDPAIFHPRREPQQSQEWLRGARR
ncbi:NAD(P)/FAD-dependent oxidoreductase [Nocardioides sp.]|uniref:NAD(P)/FAD-dependent oxidoreductase n=1 Tax=Nocardioides sp. TaxID=35761 RepID=UPI0035B31FA1